MQCYSINIVVIDPRESDYDKLFCDNASLNTIPEQNPKQHRAFLSYLPLFQEMTGTSTSLTTALHTLCSGTHFCQRKQHKDSTSSRKYLCC